MEIVNTIETQRIGNTRKEWIDALRALAMIFVIYGHQIPSITGYFVFTSPIKICLFFAITGYVFNNKRGETIYFLKKLILQLIIPWLALSMIPYVFLCLFRGGFGYLFGHFVDVIIGREKWYMPCCIIAELIWFFILKYGKRTKIIIIISFVCSGFGLLISKYSLLDVSMINRAMVCQVYLLIGYLYKQYSDYIEKYNEKKLFIFGMILYLLLGVFTMLFYPGKCLDVHTNSYYNLPLCLSMIVVGNITLFLLGDKILYKYPKVLVILGQHTLVVYLFHTYAVSACKKLFSIIGIDINWMTNFLLTALVCGACCVLSIIITKFMPALVGKKK